MMPTFTQIGSAVTATGSSSSVTFSSIPSTFTDLVIMASMRHASSNDQAMGDIQINGSTSASIRLVAGTGSGAFSSTAPAYGINPANFTANTFNSSTFYFPNYTSSANKSLSIDSVNENNATAAVAALNAGLFSTSAAITSITLNAYAGNFAANSTFYLYGVSNA